MADGTGISWTDATWNPIVGCQAVSPGCDHCYAARETSGRLRHHPAYAGLAEDGKFVGTVRLLPDRLDQPLRWSRPRRVFVNSMSDLFHDDVPDHYIVAVFAVMALSARHTYQVLTKRHSRMRALLRQPGFRAAVAEQATELMAAKLWPRGQLDLGGQRLAGDSGLGGRCTVTETRTGGNLWTPPWPLPNVWLGISVENQRWADIRVPALLDTPAAVRWLSCEPLLGWVDLSAWLDPGLMCQFECAGRQTGARPDCCVACRRLAGMLRDIDWVVVGGESGPGARPMHPDWAGSLRDQCVSIGVPFHFKQWGDWRPIGPLYGDSDEVDDAHMRAAHAEAVLRREVIQLERDGYIAQGSQPTDIRTWLMERTGKRTAGRELDGRTWDQFPSVAELTEVNKP